MFDIGFFEIVMVAVVALLVLGPQKLPQAIRTLGLYIGRFKQMARSIQQDVNEQLELEEMRQRLDEHEKRILSQVKQEEEKLQAELEQVATTETAANQPPAATSAAEETK